MNLTNKKQMQSIRTYLFFISLLFATTISANSVYSTFLDGSISGKVIDSKTKKGLPYVSIALKNADKAITGGITDEKGNFSISKIPTGKYTVEISYIGFNNIQKQVEITNSKNNISLGVLLLTESSTALDEVTIISETSSVVQKIDRKVINVGKDLINSGTTASQLLNNVQSVSVDSQTGNISLRGNENVRVLIDGKPTNMNAADLLKQIPSTSIKSVELITNPSAKYNPEGMSGMINIVLHKNASLGFNGSVNSGITQGINTRYNGSLDVNFKKNKLNVFSNYGLNTGKSESTGRINRTNGILSQDISRNDKETSHLLKIGFDYNINDKNTFSAYTIQNISTEDNFTRSIVINNPENREDSNNPNTSLEDSKSATYDFSYRKDFENPEENIVIGVNLAKNKRPEYADFKNTIEPNDFTRNYIDTVQVNNVLALYNLDYTKPLSEKSKLEFGLEARMDNITNAIETTQYITDPNNTANTIPRGNSSFEYDRKIYSTYMNYNQKFNKLSMQLGARLEKYDVTGTFKTETETAPYTDEILTIYPSTFFTYNASKKNQFQLSYSRRVDRPSVDQVNPIRRWSTPLVTAVGNPELKPQFTNSFEFNYTYQYEKGSLSVGSFFRVVEDNITRVLSIDKTNSDRVELSYMNTISNNRYGTEVSSNHAITNWWRLNASTELYVQNESGLSSGNLVEIQNIAFNTRISNSISATKDLRFQLFGMYRGGGQNIQFKIKPMWMVNTGASLNVLKGQGTLTLTFNDIFKSMRFGFETRAPIPQSGQFVWESRTAFLGFNYKFGKPPKEKSSKRRDSNSQQSGGSGGFM